MQHYLSRRWRTWIHRRLPRADERTFSQRTIFILPTGAGWVFGILLLIMLVTGINYQNSLIYLMTFLLGALFVGAMHQTHNNLSGLTLALVQAGEGFAGEDIPWRFRLTAGRHSAAAIRLFCSGEPHILHVPAGESREVTLAFPAGQRGYVRPERIRVETRFPFGLLKAWSWLRPASSALAFPAPMVTSDRPGQTEPGEQDQQAEAAPGQDHADLRPWREGDLSQRVQWKRFARTGDLMVADWQGESGSPNWLDFSAWPGVDAERRLSYLAALVLERAQRGVPWGLRLPGQVLEPDQGTAHRQRCLRALATWNRQPPRDPEPRALGSRRRREKNGSKETATGAAEVSP